MAAILVSKSDHLDDDDGSSGNNEDSEPEQTTLKESSAPVHSMVKWLHCCHIFQSNSSCKHCFPFHSIRLGRKQKRALSGQRVVLTIDHGSLVSVSFVATFQTHVTVQTETLIIKLATYM